MSNQTQRSGQRNLLGISALTAVLATLLTFPMVKAQALAPADPFTNLQARLDRLATSIHGVASVEVLDLSSGRVVAYSKHADMPAASTIKIPVMVEVFRQIADGTLNLTDTIAVQDGDRDYGFGALAHVKTGREYTVQYLLDAMITVSDNTATNMLMRTVGLDNINKTMASLGLTHTVVPDYIRTDRFTGDVRSLRSCADDMVALLAMMYKGTLVDASSSQAMLDVLSLQTHNGLIPRPLPRGLRIAHKTGTLSDTLNDVGIVFVNQHPYVLAVMTTGLSRNAGITFIRNVSRVAYAQETAKPLDPTVAPAPRKKVFTTHRPKLRRTSTGN